MNDITTEDDKLFGSEHVDAYEESDGEHGYHWRGTTILLLTTVGRKSGEKRTTPLIHRTDGERYVIIASNGGATDHPAWFKNFSANPSVEIQVKAEKFPVSVSIAEGEERERLWKLMTEVWPDYDSYQENTDREIPVVVLERS